MCSSDLIKIRKWEHNKGNTRIEFVCGNRAFEDYSWKHDYIKEIGLLLSSKDKDILLKVTKLFEAKEELEKDNRKIKSSLYQYIAQDFLSQSQLINGIKYIMVETKDMDFKDISYISTYLNNNSEKLIQIYGLSNDFEGQFFVSRSKDLDINLKVILEEIAKEYEIKGGGSPNTVQGGSSAEDLKSIIQMFFEKLKQNKL